MYWLRQNKTHIYIIVILIAVLPIITPLFHSGFFVTDDAEWMIIRLSAFYQAFADGQFPVRFLGRLNHEYGYPASTFLYPGYLYIGSIIHLLKIEFVDTVKIILGLSVISSALFTFFWLRRFFEKIPSLIGSMSFIYAPYFLFDIYTRGSVGEVLALSVIPFILWQIERKSLLLASLGIGLLILSHNSLAALFMIFAIAYMALDVYLAKRKVQLTYMYALGILLGLGLAAFFWLPILFELQLTKFSETVISNPFEYFADAGLIGFSTLLVFLITGYMFLFKKIQIKKHRLTALLFVTGIASAFLASSYSGFLWSILPVSFIQFPFRLLSVTVISGAFLTAFAISRMSGMREKIFIIVLIAIFIATAYSSLSRIEYADKEEGFYITNSATTTVHGEYMPVWVKEEPAMRFDQKVEVIGEGDIKNLVYNNKSIDFDADLKSNSVIRINTIYWPGWEARIDDKKTEILYNNPGGLMQLETDEGMHHLSLEFSETDYRLVADFISVLSLIMLIFLSRKKLLWKK